MVCRCKRFFGLIIPALILGLALCLFVSCGEDKKESEEYETFEIALITDSNKVEENAFIGSTWDAIQGFCEEYQMSCQYFAADITSDTDEKGMIKACKDAVDKARSEGAKVVVFAGNQFETTVHGIQGDYEDLYFILLDGVPRDGEYNYEMAPNSTGVLFAEEQAGFLAGYAAVADGHTKLGFMGGKDIPPVKRYGYGFIQGASAAAKDGNKPGVEIKYGYTDTFNEEDWIQEASQEWYEGGTQVIFACGGSIGNSVITGAEYSGGKVIGVDTDQSALSETIITSARKEIKTAIYDILKTYIHDNFKGNSIFNYNLENNGVSLEMINARFTNFGSPQYDEVVKRINEGELKIEKEMGTKSPEELAPDNVKVIISDFQD